MTCVFLPRGNRRAEPVLEADLTDGRVAGGDQGHVAQCRAKVSGILISDDFTRIVAGAKTLPDELVETKPLRPSHLNHAVQRRANCNFRDGFGYVLGCDWLDENRRQANLAAKVAESAMLFTNSKNCVAWTIEYGIPDSPISFSWAILARIYGASCRRSAPTTDSAT